MEHISTLGNQFAGYLGIGRSLFKQSAITEAQGSQQDEEDINHHSNSSHSGPMEEDDNAQDLKEGIDIPGATRKLRSGRVGVTNLTANIPKATVEKTRPSRRSRQDKSPPTLRTSARTSSGASHAPVDGQWEGRRDDVPARKSAKRLKPNSIAKSPILPPRIGNRAIPPRNEGRLESLQHKRKGGTGAGGGDFNVHRLHISSATDSVSGTPATDRTRSRKVLSIDEARQNEEGSDSGESSETELSEIGLYENPSPVKRASPLKKNVALRNRSHQSQANPNNVNVNNVRPPMLVDSSEPAQSESDAARLDSSFSGLLSAELNIIQAMINCANHVGYKRLRNGDWQLDTSAKELVNKVDSVEGRRLDSRLDALARDYTALRLATDEAVTLAAQVKVTASITKVKSAIDTILSNRFGAPSEHLEQNERTRTVLNELYFSLVPSFLQVLQAAAHARSDQESISELDILETVGLFDMFYDLSNTAILQPKELQPKISSNKSYQLKKPIKQIIPMIRQVKAMLLKVLHERARDAERITREEKIREAKIRKEEEGKRMHAAIEVERKRRAKVRAEHLERRRNDPTWGRLIKAEEAKIDARQAPQYTAFATRRNSKTPGQTEEREVDEYDSRYELDDNWDIENQEVRDGKGEDSDDPFADEFEDAKIGDAAGEGVERVEVFPRDNLRGSSRIWTPEERHEFISIMMNEERGYDRYQDAADQLDASLPDIHDLAKELQDLMDRLHAEGNMNTAADSWTYQIWDPKNGQ